MDGQFQLTKLDAARRQLHVAITLLFDNADAVAVHTLVGAASVIISDLVAQHHPERSWDKMAQEANSITPSQYFQVMRKPQNFLKHARDDASAVFDFDSNETEAVAFWAVMNLAIFGQLSVHESVLQLWYLACHAPRLELDIEPYKKALDVFGDLRNSPCIHRLAIGKRVLVEQLADVG